MQQLTNTEALIATFNLALVTAGFGQTDRANYTVIVEEIISDYNDDVGNMFIELMTRVASGKLGASECDDFAKHFNGYLVATANIMQMNGKKLRSLIEENLIGSTAFLILFMNAATIKLGLQG